MPGIMCQETGIQILRESGIMSGIFGFAHEYVDIVKIFHSCGLPGRSSSGFAFSYAVIRSSAYMGFVACQGVVRNEIRDYFGD